MPNAASSDSITFGPFEFDADAGLLYEGEREILLPPRGVGVLAVFLRRPGEVLSKDELLGEVWRDAFVGEDSLTQAISMVRHALGDDPRDPTYIQTVPKRGYRFIAEVGGADTPAAEADVGAKGERGAAATQPAAAASPADAAGPADSAALAEAAGSAEAGAAASTGIPPARAVGAGERLGHYEILDELGAGAMGRVFRARDTVLGREVAIKVLSPGFVADSERVKRLEREATLLASVSHPHIAAIHSLEEADGVKFPVLELVEGDTLAQRLESGPISVQQALELARQIASALEAAHERGIVHRDLKPANIKLTPEGQVKVLDFGLAKALEVKVFGDGGVGAPTESMTIVGSRRGAIVGTAAYMSPEQARGQEADRRADIWAFGCVLYEMLTGQRAFGGETVSDTIAGLLEREPDQDALPPDTPSAARRLLRRCLSKDPRDRLHDIADARIELGEALSAPAAGEMGGGEVGGFAETGAIARERPLWRRPLPWGFAAAALILAVGTLLWSAMRARAPLQVHRYAIQVDVDPKLAESWRGGNLLAISPDGSSIVYRGLDQSGAGAGSTKLYLHRVDAPPAIELDDTERAAAPFFSPDGDQIGFFQDGKLKVLSVTGGAPQELCDVLDPVRGGTWLADDTIVFGSAGSLIQISTAGSGWGTPEIIAVPRLEQGEISYSWPQAIPGQSAVLYELLTSDVKSRNDTKIAILDLETLERHHVFDGGRTPVVAPTGHLVYQRGGSLWAVGFDRAARAARGQPLEIERGLEVSPGAPTFALAATAGTLAYVPGLPYPDERQLVWVDRPDRVSPVAEQTFDVSAVELSPDGRMVAIDTAGPNADIVVYDLTALRPLRRLGDDWEQRFGTWITDRRFFYRENKETVWSVHSLDLDGGEPERMPIELGDYVSPFPASVSPDGRWLAIDAVHPATGMDLLLVPLDADPLPQDLLVTEANESWPTFSPDGRFIAYISDEGGQEEVYVMPASARGIRGQPVSAADCHAFRWGVDSDVLYCAQHPTSGAIPNVVVGIPVRPGPSFGVPTPAFKLDGRFTEWGPARWDVGNDGRLLAQLELEPYVMPTKINVVLNWFERLKEQVPPER